MSPSTRARLVTVTLALAGVVAMGVGAAALLTPDAFFAGSGIHLGAGVSLRSELRAAGGSNACMGVLMLTGAFAHELRFTSALLVATFYLAYGASRLFAVALDGLPDPALVAAGAVELVLGGVGLLLLVRGHAR